MSLAGSLGLKSLFSLASLLGLDVVAKSFTATAAASSNGFILSNAGARVKLSSGGTTDYLYSDGASTVSVAGSFSVDGARIDVRSASWTHATFGTVGNAYVSLAINGNGSGSLAMQRVCGSNVLSLAEVGGLLNVNSTSVGNVGAGEDNLMTYTLQSSSLSFNGAIARVRAWGTIANNANAKTVKMYFGSTVVFSQAMPINEADSWLIEADIVRTGAATQIAIAKLTRSGTGSFAEASTTSPAETLASDVTIKCTGTATNDNDVVQLGMTVEWL